MLGTIIDSSPTSSGATDFASQDRAALLQSVRTAAQLAYDRHRAAVESFERLVGSLAGLPGRKVVVYVGTGIPLRPGDALLQRVEARFGDFGGTFSAALESSRYSLTSFVESLARRANASGVTLVGVDAAGGRAMAAVGASRRTMTSDKELSLADALGAQGTIQTLAAVTGGRALLQGARVADGLRAALADRDAAYSLGFAPPAGAPGREHRIRVKVRRPDLVVRHRTTYLDRTPDIRIADKVVAALLFDSTENPFRAEVSSTIGETGKDGRRAVTLLAMVPLASLALVPAGAAHEGHLSFWLALEDGQRRLSLGRRAELPVRIPNESLLTALGQSAGFTFDLRLPAGPQRAALGIRDDVTGEEAVLLTALQLPEAAAP